MVPSATGDRGQAILPAAAFRAASFLIATGAILIAQSPSAQFDFATIRPSHSTSTERVKQFDGRQFTISNATIAEVLPFAFLRRESTIAGIPGWFRTDRYDIVAKTSPDTTEAALALTLQSLLARELKLTFHEERRPMETFALIGATAEGGPKLRKVPGPGYPGCDRGESTIETGQQEADCAAITLANLMAFLSNVAPDYIDRPIVDQTGIKGTYEIKLTWTPRRIGGQTLFDALKNQLGLKLEPQKLPVPVIVIDHAERPAEE